MPTPNVIVGRNVNSVFEDLLWCVRSSGVVRKSRNGMVMQLEQPTIVTYLRPYERVLFNSLRDANPFFHMFETMWMFAGANNIDFVARFAKNMLNYSDDGVTQHGAYGYRWRRHWYVDQLHAVIRELHERPSSRRAVITMWDPAADLHMMETGKDIPCNLIATVQIQHEKVVLSVFNRSNDIVWGLCGSNAVHFSFLQEYIACALGRDVGEYNQITVNAHLYMNDQGLKVLDRPRSDDYYNNDMVLHGPRLFTGKNGQRAFDHDATTFVAGGDNFQGSYFPEVVQPMYNAWVAHKTNTDPDIHINKIGAKDWKIACREWIQRRRASSPVSSSSEQDIA